MKAYQNNVIEKVEGTIPPLDKIILKLSADAPKAEINDHVIVQYDRPQNKAETLAVKRSFWDTLFGSKKTVEYYRIDTYDQASVTFNLIYHVKQLGYSEMEITFNCTLSAKEGGETKLVEALVRRDTPTQILSNLFHEWIVRAISDNLNSLYNNFGEFAATFNRTLSNQAAAIGLKLHLTTAYEGQSIANETIRPSAKDVQVQPKGYNNYLKLDFDAVMIPDKQTKSAALVVLGHQNRAEFQNSLTYWLQDYIRETITYNDITNYLHLKVRTGIIQYWNARLTEENKGWMVAELVLSSTDVPPASFKFERMEIEVQLKNAKIPLTNTVLLNLEDAERFRNSRVSNLELWIKEKLQQTAHSVLSKVSYAELVSDVDQLGGIIKSHLDKQALSIGYRVEYLLTSELVDKAKLNFQFHFDEDEQVFQTTLNEKINLNVNVSGRIRSLNHDVWKSTLTPETDFVQEMKKEVLRVVRQLLFRTNADDFYTKFNDVVEPKLVKEIKNLLTEHFNVEPTVDISPQMEVSAIREIIRGIQQGVQRIDINCFDNGAAFRITFSVMAVDPSKWSLFASRSYASAAEIKAEVAERIRVFVENTVRVAIPDIDVLRDARVFKLIEKYAQQSDQVVREKLGLTIDIIDVEQINNRIADIMSGKNLALAEIKIHKLMDALTKVDEEILDAIENGDDDWEIQDLEEKKNRLQKRLDNEKFTNNHLSHKSGERNFNQLLDGNTDTKKLNDNSDYKPNLTEDGISEGV